MINFLLFSARVRALFFYFLFSGDICVLRFVQGIKGWFPVNRPHRKRPKEVFHHTCDTDEFGDFAGGLEVALNFAKESDRELVINTARGIGWSPLESLEMHEDSFSATATADIAIVGLNAHISVSKVWIATEILEKWTDKDIRNLRLYCRYKFYDKGW